MPEIVIPYKPRAQFAGYHERVERFSKIVAHRRAGKTVAIINELIRAALTNARTAPPPRYAYIAPTYAQAKDVVWNYLKYYTAPIPGVDARESDLSVEFPNGGRVRLYGCDNYDRLRGLYFDGMALDEPAQMDPRAWPEVLRPCLADQRGWCTVIGTPSGKDWFYRVDRNDDGDPVADWFRLTLKASETGILPEDELKALYQTLGHDAYQREMECSFDTAVAGAYYSALLVDAQKEGRIGKVAADPLLPLRAFHDIGGSGANADAYTIWIVQWVAQEIRVLDYYESRGQVLAHHVNWMREKGYGSSVGYLPHDGINANVITGRRYVDHWRDAGFQMEPPVENQGPGAAMMRIEALRRLGNRLWFNEETTRHGRDALAHYHERIDDKRNVGLGPEHNWASHAADALGMMAVVYREPAAMGAFNKPIKFRDGAYA